MAESSFGVNCLQKEKTNNVLFENDFLKVVDWVSVFEVGVKNKEGDVSSWHSFTPHCFPAMMLGSPGFSYRYVSSDEIHLIFEGDQTGYMLIIKFLYLDGCSQGVMKISWQ